MKKPVGCWYGRLLMGISTPLTITLIALPFGYMSTSLLKNNWNICIIVNFQIQNVVSQFPQYRYKYWLFLHVCNLHIDLVLFLCLVPLQQNYEFKFWGAILSQNLVARVRHLVLVLPVVECDQCVCDHGALSWNGQKRWISKLDVYWSAWVFCKTCSFKCFYLN